MKKIFTNRHNIPPAIAKLIEWIQGEYDPGKCDFTCTELLGPPKIRALRASLEEVEVDVADAFYAALGSATHKWIEMLSEREPSRYVTEKRFFREIEGVFISAQVDLWDKEENTLSDWKQTRWATYATGVKWEYMAQLNICRWAMGPEGESITGLKSGALFRDFSKSTCKIKPPHQPAQEFNVPIWPTDKVEELIVNRIRMHREAESALPACTPDEMWQQDEKWAVEPIKGGKARKLFYTEQAAEEWRNEGKAPHSLITVHRPGKCVRCQDWCDVASVCEQWRMNPMNPKNR